MFIKKNKIFLSILLGIISINSNSKADNHDVNEILSLIQKDLKTLEKAVYSQSGKLLDENSNNSLPSDTNSEDVLTRHLLKLSEIENQFQQLTNKFEEINFKLDKLSNRLSKVQADNQIRFQDLENSTFKKETNNNVSKNYNKEKELLPGSSQPQDLGTISYLSLIHI